MLRKSFTPLIQSTKRFNRINSPVVFQMAKRSIISIEEAGKMPRKYNEMPNEILLSMAVMGDQEAREERLIREIMRSDNVTW
jgi:hypothetical protein